MALSLQQVSCARGGLTLLEGLSFTVEPGQALVLRGPNGIGKTTLLRTVAGLQPPVAGTIAPGDDQIAYAGHKDSVKATLTVEENLAFWANVYGSTRLADAFEMFDLSSLRGRMGGQLSAGQTRRLGLARLVLSARPIWVLDEPTVSLDGFARKQLMANLRAHLSQGGAALLTSHVDLGLDADELDLTPYKAVGIAASGFDEAIE